MNITPAYSGYVIIIQQVQPQHGPLPGSGCSATQCVQVVDQLHEAVNIHSMRDAIGCVAELFTLLLCSPTTSTRLVVQPGNRTVATVAHCGVVRTELLRPSASLYIH